MTSVCSNISIQKQHKQYNINTYHNSIEIVITDHLYLRCIIIAIVECTTMSNVTMGQTL